MNLAAFRGRRVLVTGHTGFKGSWLALWLEMLGAKVTGIALAPVTEPSHWRLLDLDLESHDVDIRDAAALHAAVTRADPDLVFHLAAQPLVRRSYLDPINTWATNVMGSVHLLEACRALGGLAGVVMVTTDKCYRNREWVWGYREDDELGGHDPYSASKAGSELVAASWREAFWPADDAPLLATARAGNVIGGGDWSEDRLVPDLVRAVATGQRLLIRSPNATRPWQHVLESLAGYLMLGARLLERDWSVAQAWNFGPDVQGNRTVAEMLEGMSAHWPELAWDADSSPRPYEATLLHLDNAKARNHLGWQPVWSFEDTLKVTSKWYREYLSTGCLLSRAQIELYSAACGSC